MKPEWLRAIGKAASALRYSAEYDVVLSEQARAELRAIAETLSEIESAHKHLCESCGGLGQINGGLGPMVMCRMCDGVGIQC